MSGTQLADPTTLSYIARRGVAVQWRGFLRALVETLDAHLDPTSRDSPAARGGRPDGGAGTDAGLRYPG